MFTVTADYANTYTRQVRTWEEVIEQVRHISSTFHMASAVSKNGQPGTFFCMIDSNDNFVGSLYK